MTYERGANMPLQHAENQGAAHEALPSFFAYETLDSVPEWGATPLGLTNDPHIRELQKERFYSRELMERGMHYLKDVPETVTHLCATTLDSVNHRRGIENSGSYIFRKREELAAPEEYREIIADVEAAAHEGRATPFGLLTLQRALNLPSIELAKTTFRGESWPAARQDVRNAMEDIDRNAVWVESSIDKMPRIGLAAFEYKRDENGKIFDYELHGFTIRTRKYRGMIDDKTHVREVMSMIVRTDDASGFEEWFRQVNPDIPADVSVNHLLHDIFKPHIAPQDTLGKYSPLMDTLHSALEDDNLPFPSWAIPITSTIYSYDPSHAKNKHEHDVIARMSAIQVLLEQESETPNVLDKEDKGLKSKSSRLTEEERSKLFSEHIAALEKNELERELLRQMQANKFGSFVLKNS